MTRLARLDRLGELGDDPGEQLGTGRPGVPLEERPDLGVGGGVGRVGRVRQHVGERRGQLEQRPRPDPLITAALVSLGVLGRGGDDDAVAPSHLAPAAGELAGRVAQVPPRRRQKQVMTPLRIALPRGLKRGGHDGEGGSEQVGQLGRPVDVETHRTASADVQGEGVVGAGEPADDRLGVAAGLRRPIPAEHAAGVLAGAADRQDVPPRFGVGEGGGQGVLLGVDLGDVQVGHAPRPPCSNRAGRAAAYAC